MTLSFCTEVSPIHISWIRIFKRLGVPVITNIVNLAKINILQNTVELLHWDMQVYIYIYIYDLVYGLRINISACQWCHKWFSQNVRSISGDWIPAYYIDCTNPQLQWSNALSTYIEPPIIPVYSRWDNSALIDLSFTRWFKTGCWK
jgi:hypothetical protein